MYLLDSNVFIEAKNRYYPFDVVPGFWDWIQVAHQTCGVCIVEAVRDELVDADDDLSAWIKALPSSFILPSSVISTGILRSLSVWASSSSQYSAAAVSEFLSVADYLLVAHARTISATVVTNEVPAPAARKRIKVPDACNALGVSFLSPFGVMRAERVRLTL
ncbi:DUF4411 family protein [Micromonospora sp. NPDC003944]